GRSRIRDDDGRAEPDRPAWGGEQQEGEKGKSQREPAQSHSANLLPKLPLLQLRAEKSQGVLPDLLAEGTLLPLLERDAPGALQVVLEDAQLGPREIAVVDVEVGFVVGAEGARIEVGRADR